MAWYTFFADGKQLAAAMTPEDAEEKRKRLLLEHGDKLIVIIDREIVPSHVPLIKGGSDGCD